MVFRPVLQPVQKIPNFPKGRNGVENIFLQQISLDHGKVAAVPPA